MVSPPTRLGSDLAQTETDQHFVAPELIDHRGDTPRLMAGKCADCGALRFPAAAVCGQCLSENMTTTHLSSAGVLYASAVVHQAPKGWDLPYTLGYVDLPEGIRVLAHIAGDVAFDQTVELRLGRVGTDENGEAVMSYVFAPVG